MPPSRSQARPQAVLAPPLPSVPPPVHPPERMGERAHTHRDDLRSRGVITGKPFFGRRPEIEAVVEAFRAVPGGRGVLVSVEGETGSGKSALVSELAAVLSASGASENDPRGSAVTKPWVLEPWVLSAVCRRGPASAARPYQAMAAIFDSLARHLAGSSRQYLEVVVPRRVDDLLAIAPVLGEVPAFEPGPRFDRARDPALEAGHGAGAAFDSPQPGQGWERGHRAMRDLFHRLCRNRPVAVLLDDAAWADPASLALLAELTRPPDPPPVLWLLSCSPEELAAGWLEPVLRPQLEATSALRLLSLRLGPLSPTESRSLARQRLGSLSSHSSIVEATVEAAGGSPGWLERLVDDALDLFGAEPHAQRTALPGPAAAHPQIFGTDTRTFLPTIPTATELTIERSVARRMERVPAAARHLLRVLATAGRSLSRAEARAVLAGLEENPAAMTTTTNESSSTDIQALPIGALLDEDLVRERGRELDELAPLDPATREAILASMDALGPAHEGSSHRHPSAAAENPALSGFEGPGAQLEAARHEASLALEADQEDRAIELWQNAVDLAEGSADRWRDLASLGRALDRVGAYHLSADAYLEAVESAPAEQADALRHLAGDRLLGSGRPAAGLRVLRPLAERAGLGRLLDPAAPGGGTETRVKRTVGLALWRLRSALPSGAEASRNQLGAGTRAATSDEEHAIDLCFTLCRGLRLADPRRWQELSREHLLRALRWGDPMRTSRALALEATYLAYDGRKRRAAVERQAERALVLARQVDHPEVLGFAQAMVGQAWALLGEWRRALATLDRAQTILETECPRAWWERRTVLFSQLRTLAMMGRWSDIGHVLRQTESSDRFSQGPFFAHALESRFRWVDDLARHRPNEARRRLRLVEESDDGALAEAPIPRYWQLYGAVEVEIYDGHGARAWDLLDRHWPDVVAPRLDDAEMLRAEAWHLRARTALAGLFDLGTDRDRESTFRPTAARSIVHAEEALDQLLAIRAPCSDAAAFTVRAALEGAIGHRAEAIAHLQKAATIFDHLEMAHYAHACRFQEARASSQRPDGPRARLEELGAISPDSMARLLAPGPWG